MKPQRDTYNSNWQHDVKASRAAPDVTEGVERQPTGQADTYSSEEEALVEQRLKNLGYL
jgi:hypothetical protein